MEWQFNRGLASIVSAGRIKGDRGAAAVSFTTTGEYDGPQGTRAKARTSVFGTGRTGAVRNLWLDIAAGFAHAARLEGFVIDGDAWLGCVEPDEGRGAERANGLVRRVVELDVGGTSGVPARCIKRHDAGALCSDSDRAGLTHTNRPPVEDVVRDYDDARWIIDELLERLRRPRLARDHRDVRRDRCRNGRNEARPSRTTISRSIASE